MNQISNEMKTLATYCTYKALYDEGKDVYDIVAAFIKSAVYTDHQRIYTRVELSDLIERIFGVKFPQAVLNTAAKRLEYIDFRNRQYQIKQDFYSQADDNQNFTKTQGNSIVRAELVIKQFDKFVQTNFKKILNRVSLKQLNTSFFDYLLDINIDDEIAALVSNFIIKNEANKEFTDNLNSIRSGHILYTGLQNNNHISESGSWKNELTVYLDMEILFHIAGYNGEVYKKLAMEFLELVKRVNSKKIYIRLKYFQETKQDIENFFQAALYNFKNSIPIRTTTAMEEIVRGCRSESDVLDKQTDFFDLLNKYSILEDNHKNYYNTQFDLYNLESEEIIKKYSRNKNEEEDNIPSLKLISHINKLRRGELFTDYRECKYILMSETNKTLKMARDLILLEEEQENKNFIMLRHGKCEYIPYAVSMFTLTNAIWYRLNGAFGLSVSYPSTVNSILKAQIVLSSLISNNLSEFYQETKDSFKNGDITEKQCIARIANYRKQLKKPENITRNTVDDDYAFITEDKINAYEEEMALRRNNDREQKRKIHELEEKNKNNQKQLEVERKIHKYELRLRDLSEERQKIVNEQNNYGFYKKVEKYVKSFSLILIGIAIIIFGIIIYFFDWSTIDKWLTIMSVIATLCGIVYLIYRKQKLDIQSIVDKVSKIVFRLIKRGQTIGKLDVEQLEVRLKEIDKEIKEKQKELKKLQNQDL